MKEIFIVARILLHSNIHYPVALFHRESEPLKMRCTYIITLVFVFLLKSELSSSQAIRVFHLQGYGLSTYTQGIGSYNLRYSSFFGFGSRLELGNHLAIQSGLYIHRTGAGSEMQYFPDLSINGSFQFRQNYSNIFLKLPIDLEYTIGEKVKFGISLGGYYGFSLKTFYETDASNGFVSAELPTLDQIDRNDYGIRIWPAVHLNSSGRFQFSCGLMQEIGLMEMEFLSRHICTCLTLEVGFKPGKYP